MRFFPAVPLAAIAIAAPSISTAQPHSHNFGLADWVKLTETSPRAVSADGEWILYTVGVGAEKGPGSQEWRLMHPDGTESHPIELPKGFRPNGFTGDGRLYGTLAAGGESEIAAFVVAGLRKDSKPDSTWMVPGGIRSFRLSPDGKRFAVLADPRPKDPLEGVHTVIQPDQSSLYVLNLDQSGGGWWSPELKEVTEFAWSPDSASIALVSIVPKIGYHYVKARIDLATGSTRSR